MILFLGKFRELSVIRFLPENMEKVTSDVAEFRIFHRHIASAALHELWLLSCN